MKSDYEYTYSETSVDTKVWDIISSKQLTKEEVIEYAQESGCDKEGQVKNFSETANVRVEREETLYGSDTHIEVEGDIKYENNQ